MPFLFSQTYSEELSCNDITHVEFLALELATSKSLGWIISNYHDHGFRAYTQNGAFNWNAEVIIKIYDNTAHLLSQSNNVRTIEPGKDKANIKHFISTFNSLKGNSYPQTISSKANRKTDLVYNNIFPDENKL